MAAAARVFKVNISELLHELEVRQELLVAEIGRLRTRLCVLPTGHQEKPYLIQQITAAGAIAGELESLHALITGRRE
jgi:hypothetical protein